ncbi:tetratricopeptide repeat protein [Thalassotalea sp. M1531]|uniref:Tetratricopeptide repeat protein n=1 Tax=Thalassotalea algicola TaxID=2716224 RepID=A0A7Y0Q687_9GAMM|nr:winged helix-turn-helix domain-containing protein [Thalassotalea algicola]NMP31744.1 tetratricopeptide repeat protein [Thalassotalea algicola]
MPQYKTLDYTIDTKALTITSISGDSLNIRPKTCQLLIVLLEKQGSVVSKGELLEKVWNDTVVDEQVIFQSIKELRKIFSGIEAIKTLPKQGYIWLPDVVMHESSKPQSSSVRRVTFKPFPILLLLIVVVVTSLGFILSDNTHIPQTEDAIPVKGSVIVLPTENHIIGNDHSWVRLGMMDQLIQRLPSTEQAGVLRTDYVLQVLERAGAPFSQLDASHIPSIFNVSGADLIVATKLSGSPFDYQLSYTLYRRKSQQKGVLFNKDSQALIDELASMLAVQLGNRLPLTAIQYQSDFTDEMLGVAIDLRLEGKFEQATPLLTSIVESNPNNLTAQRLLIETYLAINNTEKAKEHLLQAMPIANELDNDNELIRLKYFNGIYLFITGQYLLANQSVEEGLAIARANNDWLFQAHLTELKATFAMRTEKLALAEKLFHEARGYHQILKCPLGETQSWIFLSELAALQEEPEKQIIALDNAFDIAIQRNLTNKLSEIEIIKNSLK